MKPNAMLEWQARCIFPWIPLFQRQNQRLLKIYKSYIYFLIFNNKTRDFLCDFNVRNNWFDRYLSSLCKHEGEVNCTLKRERCIENLLWNLCVQILRLTKQPVTTDFCAAMITMEFLLHGNIPVHCHLLREGRRAKSGSTRDHQRALGLYCWRHLSETEFRLVMATLPVTLALLMVRSPNLLLTSWESLAAEQQVKTRK